MKCVLSQLKALRDRSWFWKACHHTQKCKMFYRPWTSFHILSSIQFLARQTDWAISHDFKDRPLISFCCGWTFSPGLAPSLPAASRCCCKICRVYPYLPLPTFLPTPPCVLPLTSKTHTSIQLHSSSENQWGRSDRACLGPHFHVPPSLCLPCWKGKSFISVISWNILVLKFHSDYSINSSFLCMQFISHVICCFMLTAHLPWSSYISWVFFTCGRHMEYIM